MSMIQDYTMAGILLNTELWLLRGTILMIKNVLLMITINFKFFPLLLGVVGSQPVMASLRVYLTTLSFHSFTMNSTLHTANNT